MGDAAARQFIELLTSLGINGAQRTTLIPRMAAPGSELAAHSWLGQTSSLGELLDVDYEALPLISLYRAFDLLWKRHFAIEHALFAKTCDLFNQDTTVTLYDLTNTYFEGEAPNNASPNSGSASADSRKKPTASASTITSK